VEPKRLRPAAVLLVYTALGLLLTARYLPHPGAVVDWLIRHRGDRLTPARRAAVARDLARWHASVVVLAPGAEYVKPWLEDLLGPARRVDDVWLWEVAAPASPSGSPGRSGSPSRADVPAELRSRSPRRPL
jgi:hypothetical protein